MSKSASPRTIQQNNTIMHGPYSQLFYNDNFTFTNVSDFQHITGNTSSHSLFANVNVPSQAVRIDQRSFESSSPERDAHSHRDIVTDQGVIGVKANLPSASVIDGFCLTH